MIYFLHGLPARPASYQANAFVARAVAASGHRALVVAPQGARADGDHREYLDWGPSENWPQAIATDLPRCIDSRFHTIKSRAGRALIGLSADGFGAFNIGLRRIDTFAAVESWSGHFEATDPHLFRIYQGGHTASLWTTDAPRWLSLALTHLAAPRRR